MTVFVPSPKPVGCSVPLVALMVTLPLKPSPLQVMWSMPLGPPAAAFSASAGTLAVDGYHVVSDSLVLHATLGAPPSRFRVNACGGLLSPDTELPCR